MEEGNYVYFAENSVILSDGEYRANKMIRI